MNGTAAATSSHSFTPNGAPLESYEEGHNGTTSTYYKELSR